MATSMEGVPMWGAGHTAIWTGSRMIVWGGHTSDPGGSYDPDADSWVFINNADAPAGRVGHSAVWTGSRMIVWGGRGGGGTPPSGPRPELNTGGWYDPVRDSWTATSTTNAPFARADHTAVWTGSTMIVWGGDGGAGVGPNSTGSRWRALSLYVKN
jgi:hypothetical protein